MDLNNWQISFYMLTLNHTCYLYWNGIVWWYYFNTNIHSSNRDLFIYLKWFISIVCYRQSHWRLKLNFLIMAQKMSILSIILFQKLFPIFQFFHSWGTTNKASQQLQNIATNILEIYRYQICIIYVSLHFGLYDCNHMMS